MATTDTSSGGASEETCADVTELSLSGTWTLYYTPNTKQPPPTLDAAIAAGYQRIPARVPGNVEDALMTAARVPDLYVGDNITQAWELEYGDWWYTRMFDVPPDWPVDGDTYLTFDGIDTIADIFLNGRQIASNDNMLIPVEVRVDEYLNASENRLTVHIGSAMRHAEQFPYTPRDRNPFDHPEALWVRKAPHSYGWDIAPRLLSAGIWRAVRLVAKPRPRIDAIYVTTTALDATHNVATLEIHYELSDSPRTSNYMLDVSAVHEPTGHRFAARHRAYFLSGRFSVRVPSPQLWWPRGLGEAALYRTEITLTIDDRVAYRRVEHLGIRTIKLDRRDDPPPAGTFRLSVNDYPVSILGTNWTPLDALHGRDADRLPHALMLLDEVGCNTVRCWGGNVYEDEDFFAWCDRAGVLVWQEFAFACATYPQREDFLAAVDAEATALIKRIRNHPSLVIWCGGNENDDVYVSLGHDPNTDRISRSILYAAVRRHDPARPYLPGSPYYSPRLVDNDQRLEPPDQHLWGPRTYFKGDYFKHNNARLVSEAGFYGCPAPASLDQFLPGRSQIDPHDRVWRLHETSDLRSDTEPNRIQTAIDQAALLFGDVTRERETFIKASQICEAEGLKYMIERARLARPDSAGIIWWNLLDCWPQLVDSVIDYYFRKKLAFYYVQRVQQPICLMLTEEDGWHRKAIVANDIRTTANVSYRIAETPSDTVLLGGVATAPAGQNTVIGEIPISRTGHRCFTVEYSHGDQKLANHYIEATPPMDLDRYLSTWLPAIAALPCPIPLDEIWA